MEGITVASQLQASSGWSIMRQISLAGGERLAHKHIFTIISDQPLYAFFYYAVPGSLDYDDVIGVLHSDDVFQELFQVEDSEPGFLDAILGSMAPPTKSSYSAENYADGTAWRTTVVGMTIAADYRVSHGHPGEAGAAPAAEGGKARLYMSEERSVRGFKPVVGVLQMGSGPSNVTTGLLEVLGLLGGKDVSGALAAYRAKAKTESEDPEKQKGR